MAWRCPLRLGGAGALGVALGCCPLRGRWALRRLLRWALGVLAVVLSCCCAGCWVLGVLAVVPLAVALDR